MPKSQGSLEVVNKKEETDRYLALKECLRAIKSYKTYNSINPTEFCLVLNVTVPKKFKVLKFSKYKGTTNPKTHIITYYKEITEVTYNDKLIIHFFYRCLTEATLKWYM